MTWAARWEQMQQQAVCRRAPTLKLMLTIAVLFCRRAGQAKAQCRGVAPDAAAVQAPKCGGPLPWAAAAGA